MTEKQQKAERIVRFMNFINNYNGELRIIKNKIYDGDNLVAIYKNNELIVSKTH